MNIQIKKACHMALLAFTILVIIWMTAGLVKIYMDDEDYTDEAAMSVTSKEAHFIESQKESK
jgi:hypothetical protein